MTASGTIFKAIGGQQVVDKIVDNLYKHIGQNETLLPIFPDNLSEPARKQRLFLTQFFGGPSLYTEERGHPMLKRRHLEFEINHERKEAWLECMNKALTDANIEEPYHTAIYERITLTAEHMVNMDE